MVGTTDGRLHAIDATQGGGHMVIHHAMVVHTQPDRLYDALTQAHDLTVWMGAPTVAEPTVGSVVEIHHDQGQRILKLAITDLEAGTLVRWRVVQPVWPSDAAEQVITWSLQPFHGSTQVDFRMDGWPQDDDIYASVSYKWASFMVRLKVYLGDTREMATFLTDKTQDDTSAP
jgi:uncharacterized protein YndB with AHSA1/START domain